MPPLPAHEAMTASLAAEPAATTTIAPSASPAPTAPASLLRALQAAAPGAVFADDGHRVAYAHDASLYRQVPVAVAVPRSVDEAQALLAACHAEGAAVLARGAGTSMCGQAVNHAVVLDLSAHCT